MFKYESSSSGPSKSHPSSILPTMDVSTTLATVSYGEEDNKWRAYYADEYPHQLWWLVSSFIAFVAVCQFTSFVVGKYQARSKSTPVATESNKIQLSRLPLALVNYWRVLSYRVNIGIGSYTLNLAEVFLTCAYIVALFTWEFINSKNPSFPFLSYGPVTYPNVIFQ